MADVVIWQSSKIRPVSDDMGISLLQMSATLLDSPYRSNLCPRGDSSDSSSSDTEFLDESRPTKRSRPEEEVLLSLDENSNLIEHLVGKRRLIAMQKDVIETQLRKRPCVSNQEPNLHKRIFERPTSDPSEPALDYSNSIILPKYIENRSLATVTTVDKPTVLPDSHQESELQEKNKRLVRALIWVYNRKQKSKKEAEDECRKLRTEMEHYKALYQRMCLRMQVLEHEVSNSNSRIILRGPEF